MSEADPIRVFVTHTFQEGDDYLRIFEFLESVDRFFYINVSKPDSLPAEGGPQGVRDELERQIKAAEVLIVLPTVFEQETALTNHMIDIAAANNVSMIVMRHYGVDDAPAVIVDQAEELIPWNAREIVDSISLVARGEETTRWDVVDFPGYDADGKT